MTATAATTRPQQRARRPACVLTWDEYMAEGELMQRYDIVDGVRISMTSPTRLHQDVLMVIAEHLRAFGRRTGVGRAIVAPCDVLIERDPLRVRQPDVLFVSNEQLARCGSRSDPGPLVAAPELVVEILSPSETRSAREAKLADYSRIGVRECWIVSPEAETVEVLRLGGEAPETIGVYANSQTAASGLYPDLTIPVASLFEE